MLRYLKYWKLLLLVFGFITELSAQSPDSVTTLKEVVIVSDRITTHSVGYRMERIDSFALAVSASTNLTELLTRNSNVHIRSYGINGLSAANFRGSGNSHTAILWNGINLQSPASGELDIGLVPVGFIDEVLVQFGGTASLYGAGAIGGAIHLNNKPVFNKGISLGLSQNYGSFQRHYQGYSLGWSNSKLSTSVKVFRNTAKNDFKYRNTTLADSPLKKRVHNAVIQTGILFQNYWKWNAKNQLGIRLWLQDNEIEVPTPITVPIDNQSVQDDSFSRTLLTWEHIGKAHTSIFKTALINHNTTFSDTVSTNNFNPTIYHSLINEYEINKKIKDRLEINVGINNTYEWVNSKNHGTDNPERNRTSVFISARQPLGTKTIINLRGRQELVDGDLTPFVPSLGLEHYLANNMRLKASISRNYLIPTFNQLYWLGPGAFGNLFLKPELSWSEEVGLVFNHLSQNNRWEFNSEITAFSSQVDNWILWYQLISSQWSPNNIKKVWSRGIESTYKLKHTWAGTSAEVQVNYSFSKATNEEIYEGGNISNIGNQLIYTPQHSAKLNAIISIKTLKIGWWHHITGKQFTNSGNTEIQALSSFGISSFILSKEFKMSRFQTALQFEINNIFNKNYLVRAGYPMPLRNVRFGLNIKL